MVQAMIPQKWKVVVPTLNAAANWPTFAPPLLACARPEQVVVIDSDSQDGTPALAREAGFEVRSIPRRDFNHGGTRQLAAEVLADTEILVYMTQDAILAEPEAIANLLAAFEKPEIAAVYGRQFPRNHAGAIEAHARRFNYPAVSDIHDLDSRERLGIKSIFISNSFAAYRRSALLAVGGFRKDVIFGEDTVTAARLLLSGYQVAYSAQACVYHSHPYTWLQEFRRYFDIGVLHCREAKLLGEFGGAHGEGQRFVLSELKYLGRHAPGSILSALIRNSLKFLGYRLGKMEARWSPRIKRHLSMHPSFWTNEMRSTSPNQPINT